MNHSICSNLDEACSVAQKHSGLTREFLLSRFHDGLSPATRSHPMTKGLPEEYEACLIHPEMNLALIPSTQKVIADLFNQSWADSWGTTMKGIASRAPFRTIVSSDEYDYGVTYERSAYFVYRKRDEVVGTAGFYQDLSRPDCCYGGLFAIKKEFWATTAVYHVYRHVLETIREYQRVPRLEIFTSTSEENRRVHRFYERNHFQLLPTQFMFRNELQRCYAVSLEDDSPIWSRLVSIESRMKRVRN